MSNVDIYSLLGLITSSKFIFGVILILILFFVITFILCRKYKKSVKLFLAIWLTILCIITTIILLSRHFLSNSTTLSKKLCETKHGRWLTNPPLGKSPIFYNSPFSCDLPTRDAGRVCTDSGECEAFCQPVDSIKVGSLSSGKCYGWSIWPNHGCTEIVKQGR